MLPIAAEATNAQTQVRDRNTLQPARSSSRKDSAGRPAGTGSRMRARSAALAPNVNASMPSAHPGPEVATRIPAIIGPRISPLAIAVARSPFAGCRCSGATTIGSSPVEAGLKNPVAAPVTPASTPIDHSSAAPAISSTAIVPWLARRTRSAQTITARCEVRSAITPRPAGRRPAAAPGRPSTRPTADAEPLSSSAAKASATLIIPSPSSDTACPLNSRRYSRWRRTARLSGRPGTVPGTTRRRSRRHAAG